MEKRVLKIGGVFAFVICLALFLSFALAADSLPVNSASRQAAVDKAYQCLNNEINNKTSMALEQAIFAGLAIGSKKAEVKINNEKSSSSDCWPKDNCRLKETAQVGLALKRMGKDTSKIEKWLLSKNATPTEVIWYLEIDISDRSSAKCSIKYGKSRSIRILDDMTLSENSADDCLSISNSGYWLKINPTCLNKEFEVSCNKDFVTALLYEKRIGETVYVSSESHKSAANGSTKEQVKAKCFKTGNTCDYEGSLWAAFTLNKFGEDINAFIPYLTALAEDNLKYFPSAFLYSLSASSISNEFYSDIVQKQNRNNLWEISGSLYKKYYDTSLAMLALSNSNAAEFENARVALLAEQKSNGCWSERDSIVDTSFILYSGWSRPVSGAGGSGTSGDARCASVDAQSCENKQACLGAGGLEKANFECTGGTICCSIKVPQTSCKVQNGTLCKTDEECTEIEAASSDGSCCLGSCVKKTTAQSYTCSADVGNCKVSCNSDEQEDDSKTCEITDYKCCRAPESTGGISWFWIILLLILIILIILAIIYRDKLRVWWYKFRGNAKVSPIVKPGVPPFGGSRGMEDFRPSPKFAPVPGRRMMPPGRLQPQMRRSVSPKDKELEETLKKLKEMSK